MATLIKDGVQTLKIFENDFESDFVKMEKEFPEYQKDAFPFVLGGFGAFGNPSSFHHPFIKSIRKQVFDKLMESGILQDFTNHFNHFNHFNYQGYSVEVLFDRAMHRYPGQKPSAETAHRDITPKKYLDQHDIVFGGWVNLSKNDQFFSCLPGSHLINNELIMSIKVDSEGFSKVSPNEFINKKSFVVKCGEMIIFPQHIIHEVLAKKYNHSQYRLFLGWRLTKSKKLLFGNKEECINQLGVPLIPSGQTPPVFSQMHNTFKKRAFNWVSKEYPEKRGTLLDWFGKSFKGIEFSRFLKSLTFYNLPFENYNESERDLMLTLHPLN